MNEITVTRDIDLHLVSLDLIRHLMAEVLKDPSDVSRG